MFKSCAQLSKSCLKWPNSDFQSQFSMSKNIRIFLKKISLKNMILGAHFLLLSFFENQSRGKRQICQLWRSSQWQLLCCPNCSRNHGFMGARQPEIYEGLRIKNLRSNWRKTCQVFPVPKHQHESATRKCPMHNGNSRSPQEIRRNLQFRNNFNTRRIVWNLPSFFLYYFIIFWAIVIIPT